MSSCTVGVTVVTAAMLEGKDTDDVDDETENGHDKQSLVVHLRRLKHPLYSHIENRTCNVTR